MSKRVTWLLLLFLLLTPESNGAFAQRLKVTNEMIYQKLIEIERRVVNIEKKQAVFEERFKQIDKRFELLDKRFEDINRRFEDINKRFEDINRRFGDINKRFEDINKRFEDINRRFDQLYTFLWIITGIFTAIMVGNIGFAYWDRRTIIREAKRQVYDEMEQEIKPEKFKKVLSSLRDLAEIDENVREILKREGLL